MAGGVSVPPLPVSLNVRVLPCCMGGYLVSGHSDVCTTARPASSSPCPLLRPPQVAAEISTGDELVLSELVFGGAFNSLSPEHLAAVCSCFVWQEKAEASPKVGHGRPFRACVEPSMLVFGMHVALLMRACSLGARRFTLGGWQDGSQRLAFWWLHRGDTCLRGQGAGSGPWARRSEYGGQGALNS